MGEFITPIKSVALRCDCGCTTAVFDEYKWHDRVDYSLSFQNSNLTNTNGSVRQRISGAIKIIFGKPIYYAEVGATREDMKAFLTKAMGIVEGKDDA